MNESNIIHFLGLCGSDHSDAIELIQSKNAEIERLNIRNKALTDITKNYDWKFARAKSEAIKEFAERLKAKAFGMEESNGSF